MVSVATTIGADPTITVDAIEGVVFSADCSNDGVDPIISSLGI